jgi:hypothetical protein
VLEAGVLVKSVAAEAPKTSLHHNVIVKKWPSSTLPEADSQFIGSEAETGRGRGRIGSRADAGGVSGRVVDTTLLPPPMRIRHSAGDSSRAYHLSH